MQRHLHTYTDTHSFKWVNNSMWVIACVVLTPAPYVHKQHHYQGNWSASSLSAPTHCKASVSHCATISAITLPQHKERAMMQDGLCVVVAYRPCFMICFPLWLKDMLSYYARCCVHSVWVTEHWSKEEMLFYIQGLQPGVSGSPGVYGGISEGPWNSNWNHLYFFYLLVHDEHCHCVQFTVVYLAIVTRKYKVVATVKIFQSG